MGSHGKTTKKGNSGHDGNRNSRRKSKIGDTEIQQYLTAVQKRSKKKKERHIKPITRVMASTSHVAGREAVVGARRVTKRNPVELIKETGSCIASISDSGQGQAPLNKLDFNWIKQQLGKYNTPLEVNLQALLESIVGSCEKHSDYRQLWRVGLECSSTAVGEFWVTAARMYRGLVPEDPICFKQDGTKKTPSKIGGSLSRKFRPVGSDQNNLLAAIMYKMNELNANRTLPAEEQMKQLRPEIIKGYTAAAKKWPILAGCPQFPSSLTSMSNDQEGRFDGSASTKAVIDLIMKQYSLTPSPLGLLKAKRSARRILIQQEHAERERYIECKKQRTAADQEIENLVKAYKDDDDALFCYLRTKGSTEQIQEFMKVVNELHEGGQITNWSREMQCVLEKVCESSKKVE